MSINIGEIAGSRIRGTSPVPTCLGAPPALEFYRPCHENIFSRLKTQFRRIAALTVAVIAPARSRTRDFISELHDVILNSRWRLVLISSQTTGELDVSVCESDQVVTQTGICRRRRFDLWRAAPG
jgi:hypothetical protein